MNNVLQIVIQIKVKSQKHILLVIWTAGTLMHGSTQGDGGGDYECAILYTGSKISILGCT